ncbi:MAG: aminopeptidase, partial [Firmicutes bacterium]|nr:aminopeptidase [Bacillota bacterium]
MERTSAWSTYTPENISELDRLCDRYKAFLDKGKTERECVSYAVELAEAQGFRNLQEYIEEGRTPEAGDKLYAVGMKKMLVLFRLGSRPLAEGMNILGAHIDSPRLDVKQNPLYDTDDMAYLDTHYYGGIKKYQWVAVPMAIHGVIARTDGTIVNVTIGENDDDPVFCFTDLLIHLAQTQLQKTGATVVEGEKLDLLIGNRPIDKSELKEDEKATVKANVLAILESKYG